MFETDQQFLLGEDIKRLAHVPSEFDLYLVIPGFQDELIENGTRVNMARPGIERFVSPQTQADHYHYRKWPAKALRGR